jgi:hypothetical protein
VDYDNEASGPFVVGETLTFSGGGTAKLVSLTDAGSTGTIGFVMKTGAVPADDEGITGGTSSATGDVDGTPAAGNQQADFVVMYRMVKVPDGNFIMDMRLNATYSGAAVTSIVMTENIPTDTAASGTVNVQLASGIVTSIAYSAYSGATFTITSTDFSGDNATAGNLVTFNRPHAYVNDPTGAVGQPVRRGRKWWASTIAAPIAFVAGAEAVPPIFGSYGSDCLVKVKGYAGTFIAGRPSGGFAFNGVSGITAGAVAGSAVAFIGNVALTDADPNGSEVETSRQVVEPDELDIANLTTSLGLFCYESAAGDHPARFQIAWGEFGSQKSSGNFATQMA